MNREIPLLALILACGTTALSVETTARTEQEVRIVNGGAVQDPHLTLPKLINYTRPVYSDEARRRDIEGVVSVAAEFEIDGSFRLLRVVKGLGMGLTRTRWKRLRNGGSLPPIETASGSASLLRSTSPFPSLMIPSGCVNIPIPGRQSNATAIITWESSETPSSVGKYSERPQAATRERSC